MEDSIPTYPEHICEQMVMNGYNFGHKEWRKNYKKWLCLLLAGALAFSLAACQRSQNVDTPSDTTSANAHTSPSNATEDTKAATNATLSTSPSDATEETGTAQNRENPYAIREITDETVVAVGDKKVFNNTQITLSIPVDWKCLTASGEDNVAYYFRDAVKGENANFTQMSPSRIFTKSVHGTNIWNPCPVLMKM